MKEIEKLKTALKNCDNPIVKKQLAAKIKQLENNKIILK